MCIIINNTIKNNIAGMNQSTHKTYQNSVIITGSVISENGYKQGKKILHIPSSFYPNKHCLSI